MITLELPVKVVSEANQRCHWSSRFHRFNRQKIRVGFALLPHKHKVRFPATCVLTRIGPKKLDTDNLAGAFKAVQDSIARMCGVDDGDARWDWQYRQEVGNPKQYAIRIEIFESGTK